MKRIMLFSVLGLAACADASQYMQDDCSMRATFEQVYTCTKNRLYNDPLTSITPNPADNAEITAYGEQLSSQLRQHLITDTQARQAFAKELAEVRARHTQPSPSAQPAYR